VLGFDRAPAPDPGAGDNLTVAGEVITGAIIELRQLPWTGTAAGLYADDAKKLGEATKVISVNDPCLTTINGMPAVEGKIHMVINGADTSGYMVAATNGTDGLVADLDPKPMSIAAAALPGGALVATSIDQIASVPLPYVFGALISDTAVAGALTVFVDRVLVTGFLSHAVYTAFFGLGFAYAMTAVSASRSKRIGAVVAGSALAWGAHLLWDLPILGSLVDSGLLGTIAYAMVKSLPFLLILIPLVVKAVRDVRGFFHRHAQPEIESGVLGDEDVARLESFGGRIRARREPDGHQARHRLHHLMRAQLDLVRLHVHGFSEPEVLQAQRDFIAELKR